MAQDRNEKARNDFALAAERRKFQQAVAAGTTGVGDRFGNKIETGQLVIYIPPATGLVWQVKDVAPVLDPRAPIGVMKLTLEIMVPLTYKAGQHASDLLVVGRVSEPGHAEIGIPTPPDVADQVQELPPSDETPVEAVAPTMSPTGDTEEFRGEDFPSDRPKDGD